MDTENGQIVPEPGQTQPPAPPVIPAPPQQPAYDPRISQERAEWYVKHPDAWEETLSHVYRLQGKELPVSREEFERERLSRVRSEALTDFGLKREHAEFIHGSNEQEIYAAAKKFSELLASQAAPAPDGGKPKEPPKAPPAPTVPAPPAPAKPLTPEEEFKEAMAKLRAGEGVK